MKIKAKFYDTPVTIIAIEGAVGYAVKVVYIRQDGSVGYTYSDCPGLKIIDEDYLPKEIK